MLKGIKLVSENLTNFICDYFLLIVSDFLNLISRIRKKIIFGGNSESRMSIIRNTVRGDTYTNVVSVSYSIR